MQVVRRPPTRALHPRRAGLAHALVHGQTRRDVVGELRVRLGEDEPERGGVFDGLAGALGLVGLWMP